jgi:MFS family permease
MAKENPIASQKPPWKSSSGRFYGWTIVAVCTAVTFVVTGSRGSFGAFFKDMQENLGWDRSTTAGIVSISTLAWAVTQPGIGYLVDRYGPKRVLSACIVLLIAATLPVFWVKSVWAIYLFLGLLPGVASSGASMVPAASIIGRWFYRRAGLASGIISAAIPLGQAVFTPIAALLVAWIGWRISYIALGGALLVVLPFILKFLRDAPDQDELPESERPSISGRAHSGYSSTAGVTLAAATRTPLFWLLLLSQASCGIVDTVVGIHFIPFVSDQGRTEIVAAFLMGAVNLTAVGGSVISGWVCDRFGRKWALFVMHGLRVISLPMLVAFGLTQSLFWLLLFTPLYGGTVIMGFPASSTLVARMFGIRSVGSVYGTLQVVHHLGMAAGSYLAGMIFDAGGSYYPAFVLSAAIAALAALATLWINERRPPYYEKG